MNTTKIILLIGFTVVAVILGFSIGSHQRIIELESDVSFLYEQILLSRNHTAQVLDIIKSSQMIDERTIERIEKLEGKSASKSGYYTQDMLPEFRYDFISRCSNNGGSTTQWPDGVFTCHIGGDNLFFALPSSKSVTNGSKN